MPRGGLLAAGLYISGIAQKAVLQLLGVRLLQPAQHAVPGGDGQAVFLAEILRQQRLEKGQSAGAVGQRVEKFHREPVMIDQYPKGALPYLVEGHVGQRAAFFLLNGGGVGDLLQIVPEHTPPQPHGDGWEAPCRHVQRTAQHRHVHRLGKGGGDAEEVVPVAPLGGGINFGGVVQLHPPQAPGGGQHLVHKAVDGLEVLGHVLAETVQHIGVPPLRRYDQFAAAAAFHQLFVEHPGVVQHHLVPAHEQQRRRKAREIAEQRRAQGIGGIVGVALGVKLQQLRRHGGVDLPVFLVGFAAAGEVRPRRNADQAARKGQSQLLQLQAQGIDQSAAGAFAAQQDLVARVALFQQVLIGLQRVLHRRGIPVLRGQTVRRAEHPHAALRRQHRGKALGVFQTSAGVAAAVEIQHHAAPPLILGHDPRTLKVLEIMVLRHDLAAVQSGHQLAQLILPLSAGLQ